MADPIYCIFSSIFYPLKQHESTQQAQITCIFKKLSMQSQDVSVLQDTEFVRYLVLYGFSKGKVLSVRLTGYLAGMVFNPYLREYAVLSDLIPWSANVFVKI